MIDLLGFSVGELQIWKAIETLTTKIENIEDNAVHIKNFIELKNKVGYLGLKLDSVENGEGELDKYMKQAFDRLEKIEIEINENSAETFISLIKLEKKVNKAKQRLWKEINKTNSRIEEMQQQIEELTIVFGKLKI